ncbi:S26 family signal peptidase [Streptosporangium canum]|uniref:S26 family signal peptidase n=1 Tax=Streptosporangium canum TaxID=324952 RepID=UPI00341C4498
MIVTLTFLIGVLWMRRRLVIVNIFGLSMYPAFSPKDRVLVRRVPLSRIRAGQVIVIEGPPATGSNLHDPIAGRNETLTSSSGEVGAPRLSKIEWRRPPATGRWGEREWIIKRVAAAPGDLPPPSIFVEDDIVPEGCLLLLGDNADYSVDSRYYGYFPLERVLGVVLRRLS